LATFACQAAIVRGGLVRLDPDGLREAPRWPGRSPTWFVERVMERQAAKFQCKQRCVLNRR
jgi:hypothetical protein